MRGENMRGHLTRLTALAGPVYAELLSGVIASVIGTFWVAGLGGAAVAAVTLAGTVENLLLGLVLVVGSGTSLRLSRALGAADDTDAARTTRAAWRLCALGTLALAVPGFLLRERLAGAFLDGPAAGLAAGYLAVAFPAFGLFFGQRVADELFKGAGDTRTPMRIALLSNALLLALDPLLVLGAGPLPGLGVTGAALALTVSRAMAFAVTLRLRPRTSAPAAGVGVAMGRIVRAGSPFGLDFTARMAAGTAQLALVAGFGVAAVAGYGVGYRVLLVVTMAFYALRQAAAIEAARLTGAGESAALRSLGRATGRLAAVLGAGAAVLTAVVAVPVSALFTDDPAVAGQSAGFLRMAALYLLPYALVVALGGVHQAAGAGRSLVVAVAVGLGAQLASATALSGPLGVTGVWAGLTVGAAVQLALLLALTRRRPVPLAEPCDSGRHESHTGRAAHPTPARS
ncbi:MATE family efflux transporter [Streptomyces kaniharaensis]|uniref:Probable multidrug resistance protein NorM n=1 Tax=Streptomyces kaniharaensis TaxID=212423 RepID=A0A6N7KHD8_9ACTN|nr:MATE family efflux transporter [Streptomyces kaniharaensis]MQS10786.1 MATE family efflux transporter [Streptomyces kaniharaensis]